MTVADVIVVAPAAIIASYAAWRLVAPAIGRIAGAIERHRRPVTDQEYRAVADERAARDALRPHGSLEALSTVHAPVSVNGKETA